MSQVRAATWWNWPNNWELVEEETAVEAEARPDVAGSRR